MCISEIIYKANCIGFSGSRNPNEKSLQELRKIVEMTKGKPISVGCARGIDAEVRKLCPNAQIFAVSSGLWGEGKGAYARRSMACVDSIKGGLWISFPSNECPERLKPSKTKAFNGSGSGTWASLSYAIALNIKSLVFLNEIKPPAGWELIPIGGGWFLFSPRNIQLSLFECVNK